LLEDRPSVIVGIIVDDDDFVALSGNGLRLDPLDRSADRFFVGMTTLIFDIQIPKKIQRDRKTLRPVSPHEATLIRQRSFLQANPGMSLATPKASCSKEIRNISDVVHKSKRV
jgi:hypothetical protein